MRHLFLMAGIAFLGLAISGLGVVVAQAPQGKTADLAAEIRQADQLYVKARNAGDFKTLAEQWTLGAELNDEGKTIRGREAIMGFLRQAAQAHPKSQMKLDVESVKALSPNLARVNGLIRMTETDSPRARWYSARFESLRVKEDGVWRIASTKMEQIADATLEDMSWLAGNWQATDKTTGQMVEAKFEKTQSGKLMVGKMSTQGKDGQKVEVLQVLQADPREGAIRCWFFESTGGRAEGFIEHDGVTYNTALTGVPPVGTLGAKSESVQVLTPTGSDGFTWHVIERVIDGVRVADQKPLLFRRAK